MYELYFKDKLPTRETLSPEELVALLVQHGHLMQSSVACNGSVIYSEAASKSPITLKSLATMMIHNERI